MWRGRRVGRKNKSTKAGLLIAMLKEIISAPAKPSRGFQQALRVSLVVFGRASRLSYGGKGNEFYKSLTDDEIVALRCTGSLCPTIEVKYL